MAPSTATISAIAPSRANPSHSGMTQAAQRLPHISPAQLFILRSLLGALQAVSTRLAAGVAFWIFLRTQRYKLRPTDAAIMASARRHVVVSGSDRVQVHEWGEGSDTVLIAHGWGSRAARFSALAAALEARGWRVLAMDAPGHGDSRGNRSSLPQFIAAMDAVVAEFGPVQAVVGHSLGALAIVSARPASATAPAWFESLQKVVLISTPSGAPFLVKSFLHLLRIGTATAQRMMQHFERRFGALPEAYLANPDRLLRQLPTLLVHDRNDDIVPFAHTSSLLPAFSQGQLLATSGLGHSILTRDAATIRSICDFIGAAAPPKPTAGG